MAVKWSLLWCLQTLKYFGCRPRIYSFYYMIMYKLPYSFMVNGLRIGINWLASCGKWCTIHLFGLPSVRFVLLIWTTFVSVYNLFTIASTHTYLEHYIYSHLCYKWSAAFAIALSSTWPLTWWMHRFRYIASNPYIDLYI